jgi:sulfate permease, SulP family
VVAIGVNLSLLWLVYVATTPPMPLLGREEGTQVFRDLDTYPEDETFAGIAVLRIDSGLFFATSQALEDRIRALVGETALDAVILDLEGTDYIDSQGAAQLGEIQRFLDGEGVTLRLARVKPQVRAVLTADDFFERLGGDHAHGDVQRAVDAQVIRSG